MRQTLYPLLQPDVDALLMAGDFFHTLLRLSDEAAYIGLKAIQEIAYLCNKNDIQLIVLEGTYEHDRGQLKYFEDHQVTLVKKLDVLELGKLGYVAFVPDNLPYANIQEVLIERIKELTPDGKVNFLVYHGYLKQEIPKNVPIDPYHTLDLEVLSEYVRYGVLKGHIHVKGIIRHKHLIAINNGSMEVLRHNENSKKGCHVFKVGTEFEVDFIENPDTHLYHSITLTPDNPMQELTDQLQTLVPHCTESRFYPVYIQIVCDWSTREMIVPEAINFPKPIKFSYRFTDSNRVVSSQEELIPTTVDLPPITEDTFPELIYNGLKGQLELTRVTEILNMEVD
jgi:predicted phosphodiesterase